MNWKKAMPVPTPTPAINAKTPLDSEIALFERKEYDKAISALTNAIRLKPDDEDAFNNRGNA